MHGEANFVKIYRTQRTIRREGRIVSLLDAARSYFSIKRRPWIFFSLPQSVKDNGSKKILSQESENAIIYSRVTPRSRLLERARFDSARPRFRG